MSALSAGGNSVTRGVPRSATRFSATTRWMLSCKGDAQRLKSSIETVLALVLTTIWGRSTAAGIATAPTATESFDVALPPALSVALNV